jgi:uncharacterized protein (DUF2235 family)
VDEVSKNILICLDGTKNEVKAKAVTNVFNMAEFADSTEPGEQVLYYGPGVGTMAPPSASTGLAQRISLIGGMALGHGMRQDIAEAYTYLMNTWEPGDKVFVFGFSRGAYTARALCGMLYRIGLLRPGSDNLVPYAVRTYARNRGKDSDLSGPEGWGRMDKFAKGLSRRIQGDSLAFPVEYLGLFDTVKATKVFGRDIAWPYTRSLPNVRVIRHAVSIDEKRPQFEEYLVKPDPDQQYPALKQVWFAGVHSDVGGGFEEDSNLTLSKITMRWILDGAIRRGLKVRSGKYKYHLTKLGEKEACSDMRSTETGWRFLQAPWRWLVKPWRTRPIPDGATIHSSVEIRMDKRDPKYQPVLPANFFVEDEPWSGPPPPPDIDVSA